MNKFTPNDAQRAIMEGRKCPPKHKHSPIPGIKVLKPGELSGLPGGLIELMTPVFDELSEAFGDQK